MSRKSSWNVASQLGGNSTKGRRAGRRGRALRVEQLESRVVLSVAAHLHHVARKLDLQVGDGKSQPEEALVQIQPQPAANAQPAPVPQETATAAKMANVQAPQPAAAARNGRTLSLSARLGGGAASATGHVSSRGRVSFKGSASWGKYHTSLNVSQRHVRAVDLVFAEPAELEQV